MQYKIISSLILAGVQAVFYSYEGSYYMNSYSVLMSVYYKEKPAYLRDAMNSMWDQSIPASEFVLVCDGPLNRELDTVILNMEKAHSELKVVRLEKNMGLGSALNIGLSQCNNELIARMDSDDVSRPDRCEKQLMVFCEHPEVSICSGIVEEFSDSTDFVESRRVPPETQGEILEFAKERNPFNHPCVMYRKNEVMNAGGYQDFFLLEDYYLWIRMLQNGSIGYNLQVPLLWMRAGSEMYKRRAGWKYIKSQNELFRYMRDDNFITTMEYIRSVSLRTISSMSPNWLRAKIFRKKLRV